jgi:putative inorganic carbon (hco3(-)) transporter
VILTDGSGRLERTVLFGLGFLVVTVPLIPYPYLSVPGAPDPVVMILRHLPTLVCLLLSGPWLWRCRVGFLRKMSHLPLAWPIGALLLTSLLSAAGARSPVLSVVKTFYYFATGGLLFIVLVDHAQRRDQGRILFWCLLGTGYVVALYGIFEFATETNLIYDALFSLENETYRRLVSDPWFERRIVSTIGHPVALGAYLSLLLPLSISVASAVTSWLQRTILSLGTLSLGAALFLTFSRGAWLAGIIGVGVLLLLRRNRRLFLMTIVVTALSTGVLWSSTSVSKVTVERARDAYQSYVLDFGSTTRGAAYGFAAVLANREPMLGLGTGMYRFAAYDLRRETDIPTPLGVLDTPDNMYLMWLAENGGIGLVVALYVLVVLQQLLWRSSRQGFSVSGQLLSCGFFASITGFLVNLLTVDALYFPTTRIVFWILAGLSIVLVQSLGRSSGREVIDVLRSDEVAEGEE